MTLGIGDALPPFRISAVNAEDMKVWAKILHDPNPIHLDPAVVRAMGLGDRTINQGPANLAYIISMIEAAFPGSDLQSLEVRYLDNVFAEDAVIAGGTVTDIAKVDNTTKVTCEIWLRAEARDLVISGVAAVALPGGTMP